MQRCRRAETQEIGAETHGDRRRLQGGQVRQAQAARAVQRKPERVLRVRLRDRHPGRRLRVRRGGL